MKAEPKKMALMILAKKKAGSEEDEEPEPADDEGGAGLETAAEDILSAIESGDKALLAGALKDFVAMCRDY